MSTKTKTTTAHPLENVLSKSEIDQFEELKKKYIKVKKGNGDNEDMGDNDKNEVVSNIISISAAVLEELKYEVLSKCLIWAKKQIIKYMEFKPDTNAFKKLDIKKNVDQKVADEWMKTYSLYNQLKEKYNLANRKDGFRDQGTFNKEIDKGELMAKIHGLDLSSLIQSKKSKAFSSLNDANMILNLDEEYLNLESPQFDIFKLMNKIKRENLLALVSTYVFTSLGLFKCINVEKFQNFCYSIASGYFLDNPYHTDIHAADMTQTLYVFVNYGKLESNLFLSSFDMTSLFLAGICHDFKHPGKTNNFLIAINDEIAIRYNDHSVLENYHVSESFKLINRNKDCDIFDGVKLEEYKLIRKRMVDLVLATDMSQHQIELKFIKTQVPSLKKGTIKSIFEGEEDKVAYYDLQQQFLNVFIHAADVSNPTKPIEVYIQWAQRVVDEFFVQGDEEKKRGMKVSFLCDRDTVSLPQSQIGFIAGVVSPLFTAIVDSFPELKFCMDNIQNNMEYFKAKKEEEEKKKQK
ncbi:MAG: 3',5'-cyclic nucleotide phosphodiesterase [archaeon]|nr:3',5'-cyclic nucleotide phosphodiesterase [archaeon]